MKGDNRRLLIRRNRIAVRVLDGAWKQALPAPAVKCRRFAAAALRAIDPLDAVELCIVLADDGFVRDLNRTWRGQDRPTNVLSFPAGQPHPGGDAAEPTALGDVVVALGTTAREAAAQGKTMSDHLAHLVVHGVLHLFGHDHVKARAAAAMERLEVTILAGLGVANPYAAAA